MISTGQELIAVLFTLLLSLANFVARRAQNGRTSAERAHAVSATALQALDLLKREQAHVEQLAKLNENVQAEARIAAIETAALIAANAELRNLLSAQMQRSEALNKRLGELERDFEVQRQAMQRRIAELENGMQTAQQTIRDLQERLAAATRRAEVLEGLVVQLQAQVKNHD